MPNQPAKILIVEDEFIVAADLSARLRKIGYEVIGAVSSSVEAIEKVERESPDLVLMDIVIKGDRDGITTAEIINQKYNIPVVFLTAYADSDTFNRAKATQPFGYITKPFQQQDIQIAIEIALQRYEIETQIRQELSPTPEQLVDQDIRDQRNNFVSMAIHEMRNPLTTILAAAKLLEANSEQINEAAKEKCFRLIQTSGKKLEQLIDEMLLLETLSLGQQKCDLQPINIHEFFYDFLEQIKATYLTAQTNHELVIICPPKPIPVILDIQLTQHILHNLVTNAIKYSPQGGNITLEIMYQKQQQFKREEEAEIIPIAYPRLVFRIQDQGLGIPVADQDKIFTAFSRSSNVSNIKGTGLGLAIVKHAVELHGGSISFVSQEGIGSIFTVALPCGT